MYMYTVFFSADFSDAGLIKISKHIGHERRRLAALLGLQPPQIDQIAQDNSGDSRQILLAILQVTEYERSKLLLRYTDDTIAYL